MNTSIKAMMQQPEPIKNVGIFSLQGVLGSVVLTTLNCGAFVAVAGSLTLVASVCATGGAILLIPHWILYHLIDRSFKREEIIIDADGNEQRTLVIDRPNAHFCALIVLKIVTVVAAVLIGAAIFGIMSNPISLCVMAGTLTIGLAGLAIYAIAKDRAKINFPLLLNK